MKTLTLKMLKTLIFGKLLYHFSLLKVTELQKFLRKKQQNTF